MKGVAYVHGQIGGTRKRHDRSSMVYLVGTHTRSQDHYQRGTNASHEDMQLNLATGRAKV